MAPQVIIVIVIAIAGTAYYVMRGSRERSEFRKRIEAEGGEVLRSSRIGFFLKSPFSGVRSCPLYYRYDVQYGERKGSWYVAASAGCSEGEWAWKDSENGSELPVSRTDAFVNNSTIALGYVAGNVIAAFVVYGIFGLVYWLYLR